VVVLCSLGVVVCPAVLVVGWTLEELLSAKGWRIRKTIEDVSRE